MKKDLLSIKDLTKDEIIALIDKAITQKRSGQRVTGVLTGYTLGMIFDKCSTRTRVSFETAMFRSGGQTLFLNKNDTQIARDEPLKDTARVLSRYLDGLAIRTYAQDILEEMAEWTDIPVINALTDLYHPCQILSDLMTVKEKKGTLEGLKIAWIGDGNNMANSWINAAAVVGFELVLACPPGYHPDPDVLKDAGNHIRLLEDPAEAADGAEVINTDVWASMGQEEERNQRLQAFQRYQVDQTLLKRAARDAIVMHCLPAHRGEEIADELLEGPQSVVFDQAENKMHLHQALLETLLVRK
jgi:ornithine carbamoyltransferase